MSYCSHMADIEIPDHLNRRGTGTYDDPIRIVVDSSNPPDLPDFFKDITKEFERARNDEVTRVAESISVQNAMWKEQHRRLDVQETTSLDTVELLREILVTQTTMRAEQAELQSEQKKTLTWTRFSLIFGLPGAIWFFFQIWDKYSLGRFLPSWF